MKNNEEKLIKKSGFYYATDPIKKAKGVKYCCASTFIILQ